MFTFCEAKVVKVRVGYRVVSEKRKDLRRDLNFMVREKGLEPSRPEALAPKASVSTNSTTRACHIGI